MIKSKLDMSKFEAVDKTFSLEKANLMGTLIVIPLLTVLFLIYYFIYPKRISNYNLIYIFIDYILGIIAHEFVHGFVWHFNCEEKWESIKFGFDKKTFTPFTNCSEVLPINIYRLGAISPFLITGLLPYILGLALSNTTLIYASILLMGSAIGDFMILFTILKEKSTTFVIDHPTLCGCTIYREKEY